MGIVEFFTKAKKTEHDNPANSMGEIAQRLRAIFPEISWNVVDLDGTVGTIADPARHHGGLCGLKLDENKGAEQLVFLRTILQWPPPENEHLVVPFLNATAQFLVKNAQAAVIVGKNCPAVTFNTWITKGIVGYTDEKLRTLVELNYCLGDAVGEITISVCRREMQPSEGASEVEASLAAIMASRRWMIGDTPVGSKRIPDDTDIIGIGRNFLVNPKLWNWVNTAARRQFDEAQQAVRSLSVFLSTRYEGRMRRPPPQR
jgi:hypothetical protein